MSAEIKPHKRDTAVAIRLALCFFILFAGLTHGHFKTSDEWTVYEASASLWDIGRPAVGPAPFTHRGVDGRRYSQYMLGQSLLVMPYLLAGRAADQTLPETWRRVIAGPTMGTWATQATRGRSLAGGRPEITAITLFSPTMTALLVALCFLQQRYLGVSLKHSVLVSSLIGATTYVAMHSVYFLRHNTTTVLLMGSLLAFQRYRATANPWSLLAGGSMAVLIPLIRLPDAILGLPLAIYLAWTLYERVQGDGLAVIRPAALALGPPLLMGLGLYVTSNWIRWGSFLESPILTFSSSFSYPLLDGIRGFLFSPGVSIFAYSPLLLLLPWSATSLARLDRVFFIFCIGTSVWLLFFYSKWEYWPGLPTAPGPRYLFAVIPLLLMTLGPWLDRSPHRIGPCALYALATLGAIIQIGLVLADWRAVRVLLDVGDYSPPWDWLFVPSQSPIVGAYRVIFDGELNTMLWRISQGWPGFPPHPGLAITLILFWIVLLTLSIRALRKIMIQPAGQDSTPCVRSS